MSGLTTATGIVDQGRRTSIAQQEADSREEYRDAQIAEFEFRLREAERAAQREWDFRNEVPTIAGGPSSEQPQQAPGAETAIPRTHQMPDAPPTRRQTPVEQGAYLMEYDPNVSVPTDRRGGSSVDPGIGRSPGRNVDPQMGRAPDDRSGDTGMAVNPELSLPYIQGTNHPGDRFPRVDVPGGSVLAQPRSYHQANEALQGAHREIHGDPMPGVSSSIAQGLQPWEPRTRSQTPEERLAEWRWKEEYKREHKEPDATSRNQDFRQRENQAEAYAAMLVGQGMDMMEALDRAQKQTGVYPDATLVQRTIDANYNRLMSIYRYIDLPPTDWHAQVIFNIAIGGQSVATALRPYEMATGENASTEVFDNATGEWRTLTEDELQSIKDYIAKYGSVDNKSTVMWGQIPVGFPEDSAQ
jgi:hypothetical protein